MTSQLISDLKNFCGMFVKLSEMGGNLVAMMRVNLLMHHFVLLCRVCQRAGRLAGQQLPGKLCTLLFKI
jgi:hypothetical protein